MRVRSGRVSRCEQSVRCVIVFETGRGLCQAQHEEARSSAERNRRPTSVRRLTSDSALDDERTTPGPSYTQASTFAPVQHATANTVRPQTARRSLAPPFPSAAAFARLACDAMPIKRTPEEAARPPLARGR